MNSGLAHSSQLRSSKTPSRDLGDTIVLVARPRIHVGLVDLGHASKRCFGGVGFNVDGQYTTWRVEVSDTVSLEGIETLDCLAREQLMRVSGLLAKSFGPFKAKIERVAGQHVGLGTKTTLTLGLIAAIDKLFNLGLTEGQIIKLSGRGGASGAGIHLFFAGGVIWDGGHADMPNSALEPSSAVARSDIPPLLARWAFPPDWKIGLLLPVGTKVAGLDEEAFFQEHTPIPRSEALETMAIMYHEIVPSFVMRNLPALQQALIGLHSTGFKKREADAQTDAAKSLLKYLQLHTACGMSSMGPLMYALYDRADLKTQSILETASVDFNAKLIGVYDGWNSGFEAIRE